jgi:hypothetical protein
MKKMKVLAVVVIGALMVMTMAMNAQAQSWATGTITSLGYGFGAAYIQFTGTADAGGAAVNNWFTIDPAYMNQMLATALTAKANSMNVQVGVFGGFTDYNVMAAIYLKQ